MRADSIQHPPTGPTCMQMGCDAPARTLLVMVEQPQAKALDGTLTPLGPRRQIPVLYCVGHGEVAEHQGRQVANLSDGATEVYCFGF